MNQDRLYFKRLQMLETQIKRRGIQDKQVLSAMHIIPRHFFVPETLKDYAYEDKPLEIGYGQTISQPYIVAFMTEALQVNEESKVLEIGTGSGYQAAILSEICKEVYTIEIIKELAKSTKELFQLLGYTNIYARTGNGYKRWSEVEPFDAIIITAAIDHIIDDLLAQLKIGGRMIMPLKVDKINQVLIRITKLDANDNYKKEELMPVMFVPMTDNE
ncbi:MAG: protein-L-isoaspartate(D-aspartate) O-methyltransferase [Rickettsia sp.]|jgi:protein-L-isoaspartate(D-aspartate) O-methyltransferase|nr:protein-L-isoaspartate(D-aspartate) O-methyltransferase [Rickettsia sp.]